ncbi:Fic family protein, partial [Hyphomonas sp. UBA2654]
ELAQPMRPQDIKGGLEELCKAWVDEYPGLRNPDDKLRAISKFHARLLLIHPFLDGNGRVARAVLMQQCLDLFQRAEMSLLNKGADYYSALKNADQGNIDPLIDLIRPIVFD